jgi:hypothetical protein
MGTHYPVKCLDVEAIALNSKSPVRESLTQAGFHGQVILNLELLSTDTAILILTSDAVLAHLRRASTAPESEFRTLKGAKLTFQIFKMRIAGTDKKRCPNWERWGNIFVECW